MAETESDSDISKESGARKRQRGDINVVLVHHLLGQIQQNINVIEDMLTHIIAKQTFLNRNYIINVKLKSK